MATRTRLSVTLIIHCSSCSYIYIYIFKVKWSRYRPGVAQRVGRGIALLFHDRSTRRGWVVSSTTRPHFTPGKNPVPILQEAGWAPGSVWTGGKSRSHRHSIPDLPARSQSLYRLSYTHTHTHTHIYIYIYIYIITETYVVRTNVKTWPKFKCLFRNVLPNYLYLLHTKVPDRIEWGPFHIRPSACHTNSIT